MAVLYFRYYTGFISNDTSQFRNIEKVDNLNVGWIDIEPMKNYWDFIDQFMSNYAIEFMLKATNRTQLHGVKENEFSFIFPDHNLLFKWLYL